MNDYLQVPDHLGDVVSATVCKEKVQAYRAYQAPKKGYVAYFSAFCERLGGLRINQLLFYLKDNFLGLQLSIDI